MVKGNYSEYVGGRVTPKDAKLLKESKYNVRHAVEFFNAHVHSDKKRLEVEKFFLEEELREMKIDQIPLEQRIEEINCELGFFEIDGVEYSLDVSNAFNALKHNFLNGEKIYKENIHEFMVLNDRMVYNQAMACNMSVDEFSDAFVKFIES